MEETARKTIKNLLNDWPVRDAAHFSKVDDYEKTSKKPSTQCPVYVDCGEHDGDDDEAKEITNQKADLFLKYIHRLVL